MTTKWCVVYEGVAVTVTEKARVSTPRGAEWSQHMVPVYHVSQRKGRKAECAPIIWNCVQRRMVRMHSQPWGKSMAAAVDVISSFFMRGCAVVHSWSRQVSSLLAKAPHVKVGGVLHSVCGFEGLLHRPTSLDFAVLQ